MERRHCPSLVAKYSAYKLFRRQQCTPCQYRHLVTYRTLCCWTPDDLQSVLLGWGMPSAHASAHLANGSGLVLYLGELGFEGGTVVWSAPGDPLLPNGSVLLLVGTLLGSVHQLLWLATPPFLFIGYASLAASFPRSRGHGQLDGLCSTIGRL
jgi:hypothetical protein